MSPSLRALPHTGRAAAARPIRLGLLIAGCALFVPSALSTEVEIRVNGLVQRVHVLQ
ncbi:MAG: hypothetical protein ACREIB_03800 [Pseudomonadota bacterium]